MLATPGLRNGISPSAPTTQVKCLWVCAMPPKLDASTRPSRKTQPGWDPKVGELVEEELEDGTGMAL